MHALRRYLPIAGTLPRTDDGLMATTTANRRKMRQASSESTRAGTPEDAARLSNLLQICSRRGNRLIVGVASSLLFIEARDTFSYSHQEVGSEIGGNDLLSIALFPPTFPFHP